MENAISYTSIMQILNHLPPNQQQDNIVKPYRVSILRRFVQHKIYPPNQPAGQGC